MNHSAFTIRSATQADFEGCLAIDHNYQTNQVWQMDYHARDRLTTVRFQTVRLPQALPVAYPYSSEQLLERWYKADCFLVAEQTGQVGAYITLELALTEPAAWLKDMAVQPSLRRQGCGSKLLMAAGEWARDYGAEHMLASLPAKNSSAIHFLQKNGFSFCGYNEFLYQSGGIGLFFAAKL